jgi:hypothetical protein
MGNYYHSQWFMLYLLVSYDVILENDFMEAIPQTIDPVSNILTVPTCNLRGLIPRDRRRVGPISEYSYVHATGEEIYGHM